MFTKVMVSLVILLPALCLIRQASKIVIAHILLSLLIGGVLIAICSIAAELVGPTFGGLIAGLPSTLVISLLFVGLTESPQAASHETTFIPMALGLNCLLMGLFGICASLGLAAALGISLTVWMGVAAFAVMNPPANLEVTLLFQLAGLALGLLLTRHVVRQESAGGTHCSGSQILLRAFFGGAIVATSVWLSHVGGGTVGGIAATFPAIGISTLLIVSQSRGIAYATALLRPIMVSTCVTMLTYVLIVRYAFPAVGVWGGTALAVAGTLISAWMLYMAPKLRQPQTIAT